MDLKSLARPSGGFAMLAVDQREALRDMMVRATGGEISDQQMTDFKVKTTEVLTPYASAVLIDKEFGWDSVVEKGVVSPRCGLISAADHFIAGEGEFVRESVLDTSLDITQLKEQGAEALKLLILWREDRDPQERISQAREFIKLCQENNVISIIEPVSRGRWDLQPSDTEAGVLEAAKELGGLGADIYKAEVPFKGAASDSEVYEASQKLTDAIDGKWVVLSSGVDEERFPETVGIACRAGASGFLAGRGVWASVVGSGSLEKDLRDISIPRLKKLGQIVDDNLQH